MPFQSEAQRRMMWAQHPDIAQRWANEDKKSGRSEKGLPYHKAGAMKKKGSTMSPAGKAAMMKVRGSKNLHPKMKAALMKRVMASEQAKAGGKKMAKGKGKQKQALSQLFASMNKS